MVRVVAHGQAELGGKNHVVALADQRLAENGFRLSVGVDVRRVEIVDARVDGGIHHARALALVRVSEVAEHARTEAQLADADARPAKNPRLHARQPCSRIRSVTPSHSSCWRFQPSNKSRMIGASPCSST